MASRLSWYCTAIGAHEKAVVVLSEEGMLSLVFAGVSVHVAMHASNGRQPSETYWIVESLATRLVGLLTLPASCRGARCTLKHLATCLDAAMAMLMPRLHNEEPPTLADWRGADLSTCCFVLLLCTRVEPQSSGGVSQAIVASCKGTCHVVYTDTALHVHTDVMGAVLDSDDDGAFGSGASKWRNSMAAIACAATGGVVTVVLDASQGGAQVPRSAGLLSASLASVLSRSSAGDDVPFPLLSRRSGDGSSSTSSPRTGGTPHLPSPRSTSPRSPAVSSPRNASPRTASPRAATDAAATVSGTTAATTVEVSSEDTDEASDDDGERGRAGKPRKQSVGSGSEGGTNLLVSNLAGGLSVDHENSPSANRRVSSRTSSRGSLRGSIRSTVVSNSGGSVFDMMMGWLMEFNDWATNVPFETAFVAGLAPVLERHKRWRQLRCAAAKMPAWGVASGAAVAPASALRVAQRSTCPIGVMVAQQPSTVVLYVRTLQYERFECFAQPSHVLLTVTILNDATLGDSHKTKWGAYQELSSYELAPVYRRHVSLPCLIDPSSECIVAEGAGVVTVTYSVQGFSGSLSSSTSALMRLSPASGKSLRMRKSRK